MCQLLLLLKGSGRIVPKTTRTTYDRLYSRFSSCTPLFHNSQHQEFSLVAKCHLQQQHMGNENDKQMHQLNNLFATQQLHETHFTKEKVYSIVMDDASTSATTTTTTTASHHHHHLISSVRTIKDDDEKEEGQLLRQNNDDPTAGYQNINIVSSSSNLLSSVKSWIWRNGLVHLLPNKYPESVKQNYLQFCKWQSLQYVVSSMGGVLSMQSMLYAVGVGSGSIPLAAALNWIIKDGLGQLGGVIFASRVSTNFDSDPKKWRVRGELALMSSTLLEICTPLFPKFFLPLAAVANIGKNVSCLASSATRAAINNSFVNMDNLADITGKSGSQAIASSLIGTGLAVILSPLIGTSFSAVLPAFVVLSSIQMFALYKAVKSVQLDIFNLQRAEIVIEQYLRNGILLDTRQVCDRESFLLPYKSVLPGKLIINPNLLELCTPGTNESMIQRLQHIRHLLSNEKYLIDIDPSNSLVSMLFLKEATTHDVLKGMLHSSLLRMRLNEIKTNSRHEVDQLITTMYLEVNNVLHSFESELLQKGWTLAHDFIEERPNRVQFHH